MRLLEATLIASAGVLSLASSASIAQAVSVPQSFSTGMPAKAGEVNANFTALKNGINANAATIATFKTDLQSANLTFEGAWETGTACAANDVVAKDGLSFVSLGQLSALAQREHETAANGLVESFLVAAGGGNLDALPDMLVARQASSGVAWI